MIFPEIQQHQAGEKIGELLKQADSELLTKKHPGLIMDYLREKHLGTTHNPNLISLMPNVTPAEKGKITRLIRNHIATIGGGMKNPGFEDLQKIKMAFDAKANWDRSITSGESQMHRNFSRKIGDMIKEGIPAIKKPYADYAKAAASISKHGKGLEGLTHKLLTGGGIGGWAVRQALLYPLVRAGAGAIKGSLSATQHQQPTQGIGFQGSVH